MFRFIGSLLFLSSAALQSAIAFPTIPPPAAIQVSPLIPSPTEHAVIVVYDFAENGIQQVLKAINIQVVRSGDTFKIDATRVPSLSLDDRGPFTVDLGVLPQGRYTVQYSSAHLDDGFNPAFHVASLSFSVSTESIATVVEYYNAHLDHYFITAFENEQAKLDNGSIAGWSRTGQTFHVLPASTMPSSANPVCRFYGLPQYGLDSHFFSDDPAECEAVHEKWPAQWIEESPAVFGVPDPYSVADCRPLYRLYDNRPDANHRYTVSTAIRDEMLGKGWILEGRYNGVAGTFAMCVPN